MTKHILISLLSLLFIFVSFSKGLESQDTGLVSNDEVAREADAVHVDLSEVNSLSEEVSSARLARAAASDARERNNKESRRRRKKASKKTAKRRNKTSIKNRRNKKDGKASKKDKKDKKARKSKTKKKNKEKKTKTKSSKRKSKKKKGKKNKLAREDTDGNTITIVCPECPKTLICTKSKNRNGEKLSRKEKKMWRKTKKIEKKIEKINNKYLKQMARNGDAEEEDDKLCTPCCPDIPETTTLPSGEPTPPPPPTTPDTTLPPTNCTPCVMWTANVMDVWRFQVGNFEKQRKRVENQNNIATNKASANKTKAFTDLADHLEGLSCAMNMAEIDDTKMKLMECPAQITAACNLTKINQTFVDECTIKTGEFVAEATICKDEARKGRSDDCPCFKNLYDNLSDVKQCKIAETSTIATEFKACKTAFSDCKKLEDAVGPLVIKGMCGTTTTTGAPRLRRKWLFDKLRV